jgi:alpha-tubulin suppressor-like RCC1 family protein
LDHVALAPTAPIVVAGQSFACALDATGHAQCWGNNDYGSLGRLEHAAFVDPLPAPLYGAASALVFTQLWAGVSSNTVCGSSGADLWCWGNDGGGQAAQDPTVAGDAVYAARITAIDGPQDASCSQTECCAVDRNGVVRCWGGNLFGQLGRGTASAYEWEPAAVCDAE